MSYHLGGGEGGIDHYMKHLGPSQVKRWADHGTPEMTDDFVEQIISEVKAATHGDSVADISERRDQMLQALLGMKASAKPSH